MNLLLPLIGCMIICLPYLHYGANLMVYDGTGELRYCKSKVLLFCKKCNTQLNVQGVFFPVICKIKQQAHFSVTGFM